MDAAKDLGKDSELEFLRAENALLRTERDVLLRVATGFAEDANATLLKRRSAFGQTKRGSMMDTVWLTEESYTRLNEELAALHAADEGSDDADDRVLELRRRQARVRELEDLLHRAVVGQEPPDDGVAEPGMVLTVRFDNEDATETFLLGIREGVVDDGLDVFSPDSPLGRALTGARQGESRGYTVPSGATVRVTLLSAVPYGRHHW